MNFELIRQLGSLFLIVAAGPIIVIFISIRQGNL